MKLPSVIGEPRWGFSLGCHYRSLTEVELVVFGGFQYDLMTNEDIIRSGTTLLYLGMCMLVHYSALSPMYKPIIHTYIDIIIHTYIHT